MPRWLSLEEVSEQIGVTPRTMKRRVATRKFVAPSKFDVYEDASGVTRVRGYWPAAQVENPADDPAGAEARRRAHIAELLDECRYYFWTHAEGNIPQKATTDRQVWSRRREAVLDDAGDPLLDEQGKPVREWHEVMAPYPVGQRVSALRSAKKQGKLSRAEIKAFESIPGWAWNHDDQKWLERLEDVKSRWKRGTLRAEDRTWLYNQRLRSRMKNDRGEDVLRESWQKHLSRLPDDLRFGRGQSRVKEFVAACEQWMVENAPLSTFAMPYAATVTVDGETVPVGRRATYYRRRYHGLEGSQPLPPEEIEMIEALDGWDWAMSKEHTRRRKPRKAS